jgi:hypothetical protein
LKLFNLETAMSPEAENSAQEHCSRLLLQRCADYLPWGTLIGGLFSIVIFATIPDLPLPLLLPGYVFIICLALAVSVLLHEVAHAFVAARLGMFPIRIQVGDGKTLLRFQLGAIKLEMKQYIHCGMVTPTPPTGLTRTNYISIYAAGPMMDLVVLGFLVILHFTLPFERWQTGSQMQAGLWIALLSLGWTFIGTMLRRDCTIYGRPARTDVASIISFLQIPTEIFLGLQRIMAESGGWSERHEVIGSGLKEAAEYLTKASNKKDLDHWRDVLCTAWLLYGNPEIDAYVDQLTSDLLANAPEKITRKGTRGSVLIALGQIPAGICMLVEVLEKTKSDFDRAFSTAFLALAYQELGKPSEVEHWISEFRKFDAPPALRKRVEHLLLCSTNFTSALPR